MWLLLNRNQKQSAEVYMNPHDVCQSVCQSCMGPDRSCRLSYPHYWCYYACTNELSINKQLYFCFLVIFLLLFYPEVTFGLVFTYFLSFTCNYEVRLNWPEEEGMFVFWQHPKDSLNKCTTGITLSILQWGECLPSCHRENCNIKSHANYNLKLATDLSHPN